MRTHKGPVLPLHSRPYSLSLVLFVAVDPMVHRAWGKELVYAGEAGPECRLEIGGEIQDSLLAPDLGSYCLIVFPFKRPSQQPAQLRHRDGASGM